MKILVTGGAGFIGSHIVNTFKGDVTVLDVKETEHNPSIVGDVSNGEALMSLLSKETFDVVFHCAAQTAVTKSIEQPSKDLQDNIVGTFNLLSGLSAANQKPLVIFTSTNKVYDIRQALYVDSEAFKLKAPINESQALGFGTPYGCSKGAADQYMQVFNSLYEIPTVVLRLSCVYGPGQLGSEDQGWVAWMIRRAQAGEIIRVFGDGRQSRDLLHIDDLMQLMQKIVDDPRPGVYNVGGGEKNIASVLQLLDVLREKFDVKMSFHPWRPNDQMAYCSDIAHVKSTYGWEPKIYWKEGICELYSQS